MYFYCTWLYRVQNYSIFISSPGCPETSIKAAMMQLVLLYFSRYYTLRLKMFSLFFVFVFMYYLCENYYKPIIVQYCIANCVSWEPMLTLLKLWTKKFGLMNTLLEQSSCLCRGLTTHKQNVLVIKITPSLSICLSVSLEKCQNSPSG